MTLGSSKQQNPFRGVVTVSDRGQIVIPASLMKEIDIVKGRQLIILKRDDGQGFIALKSDAISDALLKLAQDNSI